MAISDTLIINRKLGGKLFLFYATIDAYYHYLFPGNVEGLKLFKLNDITASTLYALIAWKHTAGDIAAVITAIPCGLQS